MMPKWTYPGMKKRTAAKYDQGKYEDEQKGEGGELVRVEIW